ALVVVAVVLELQGQRLPGRLVGDAAKEADVAGKHLLEAELATLIAARVTPPHVEMVVRDPQRIADIAAGTEVAPGNTKAEIEIAPTFAGHEVFAAEKTGAAHVLKAQGDCRHVLPFLDQAQL